MYDKSYQEPINLKELLGPTFEIAMGDVAKILNNAFRVFIDASGGIEEFSCKYNLDATLISSCIHENHLPEKKILGIFFEDMTLFILDEYDKQLQKMNCSNKKEQMTEFTEKLNQFSNDYVLK